MCKIIFIPFCLKNFALVCGFDSSLIKKRLSSTFRVIYGLKTRSGLEKVFEHYLSKSSSIIYQNLRALSIKVYTAPSCVKATMP